MNDNRSDIGSAGPRPPDASQDSVAAFRQEAVRRARTLYLPGEAGTLALELAEEGPASAIALVMEHRAAESRQYHIPLLRGQRTSRMLPAGGYTVVTFAKGLKPHRTYVEISANRVAALAARLMEPAADPPSLAERAATYRLKMPSSDALQDLTVNEGATIVLDPSSRDLASNLQTVRIANLDDAKAILGQADDRWPGEQPRYGKVVEPQSAHVALTKDEGNLPLDARFALREYVYGNSRAVLGWREYLNGWLARNPIPFPVFLFQDVTVGPWGTLHIGKTGLLCNALNVHYTARVIVSGSGPTMVDMNTYNQFGLIKLPITVNF